LLKSLKPIEKLLLLLNVAPDVPAIGVYVRWVSGVLRPTLVIEMGQRRVRSWVGENEPTAADEGIESRELPGKSDRLTYGTVHK